MEEELMVLIRKATEVLKSFGATEVYLFGSVAKGTYKPGSDIDFAVSGLPPEKYYHAVGEIMSILRHPVDLIDLDHKNEFTEYLSKHGELRHVN
jgi:predicted nucleotidyltransferase